MAGYELKELQALINSIGELFPGDTPLYIKHDNPDDFVAHYSGKWPDEPKLSIVLFKKPSGGIEV